MDVRYHFPRVLYTRNSTSISPIVDNVEEDNADEVITNCCEFFSCRGWNMFWFGLAVCLWLFVSVFLAMCIYGPQNVWLGPNSSILLEPSSIFVKSIKVEDLDRSKKSGLQLFGFYGSPPLDSFVNWSESRVLPVPQDSYKGWPYYLNNGSSMNISYSVKPKGSAVQLLINEGTRDFSLSALDTIAFRDTAWSWNLIQGCGMIQLEISKSSSYYFTVANLMKKDVEVELNIDVRAVLYDTKKSFYNCTFSNDECTFNVKSLVGSSVVLTSPAPSQGVSIEDEWYIGFSYQPRWIGYVICTGLVFRFVLLAIQFCNKLLCCGGEAHLTENDSERTHLLENEDDDGSNMGSYNDSSANDYAELEEFVGNDGEASNQTEHLCAICFDSPKDCICLPCGHCVSCYECGTTMCRMAEVGGSCPICGRKMKKVIFTV